MEDGRPRKETHEVVFQRVATMILDKCQSTTFNIKQRSFSLFKILECLTDHLIACQDIGCLSEVAEVLSSILASVSTSKQFYLYTWRIIAKVVSKLTFVARSSRLFFVVRFRLQ
jgi:hypothetical protein